MVARRRWSAAEFRELFVAAPAAVAHRAAAGVAAPSGRSTGVPGRRGPHVRRRRRRRRSTLPDAARGRRRAPAATWAATLDGWSEVFADYEILQPFPQLGRPVYALTDEERGRARLGRFEGVTVPTGKAAGAASGAAGSAARRRTRGVECWISRRVGADRFCRDRPGPGHRGRDSRGVPRAADSTRSGSTPTRPDHHWRRRQASPRFGKLDPVTASEVLADLEEARSR